MEIDKMLERVGEISDSYKKEKTQQKKEAVYFNPITKFFSVGENKLSEILTFFLDPKESHGQGNVFLESFLKFINSCIDETSRKININEVLSKDVFIKTERPTDEGRRMDIYIEFGNMEYIIVIENKLGAVDQKSQLVDYFDFINKKTKSSLLIYLTPFGKIASDESLQNDKFRLTEKDYIRINYHKQIIGLIDKWIDIVEATRVKLFLSDFRNYLNKQINDIDVMNELSNKISDSIIKNNEIELAFEVSKAINIIKNKLFVKLKEILSNNGFIFDEKFGSTNNEAILKLDYEIELAIIFLGNRDWFVIGISTNEDNQDYINKLIDSLEDLKIGKNEEWVDWSWVTRTDDYSRWDDYKPWLKVKNGEFERFIRDIVDKVKSIN
jgi:hypothetical protein